MGLSRCPPREPCAARQRGLTAASVLDLLFLLSLRALPPAAHTYRREALQRIRSVTLDAGSEGKGALQEVALCMTLGTAGMSSAWWDCGVTRSSRWERRSWLRS